MRRMTGGGSRSPRPPWRRGRRPPPRCPGSAEGTGDGRRRGGGGRCSPAGPWGVREPRCAARLLGVAEGQLMISPGAGAGRAARRTRPPRCLLAPSGPGHRRGGQCRARGGNAPSSLLAPPARSRVGAAPGVSARPPWRGSWGNQRVQPRPLPSQAQGVRAPGAGSRTGARAASRGGMWNQPRSASATSAFTPARSEQPWALRSLQGPVEAESCLVSVADAQRTFHGALHQRLPHNLGCNEVKSCIFYTG